MDQKNLISPTSASKADDMLDFDDVLMGGCSVSPVRASDLDRVSTTSSNSKSRESLTSTTSRSTLSSVDQQHHHHRPRSATTVSNTSDGSHFLRPKSLAISSGLVKIWRKERARHCHQEQADMAGTSCPTGNRPVPRRKSDRKSVPLIRYDFVSAPSTPNSETDTLWMDPEHSGSSERIPEMEKKNKRSGSRLSLNINPMTSGDKSQGPSPNSKSPKMISRFLRNSFARIMSLKSGSSANDDLNYSEAVETINENFSPREYEEINSPEVQGQLPCTPSTQAYIEETRLSGLPVIPFAYPTCVIVERMKNKTRERVRQNSDEFPSPAPAQQAAPSGITAGYEFEDSHYFDPAAHSPLENLVDIASQELTEDEALFGLYDDNLHGHAGSVGSAGSAFDFFYNGCENRRGAKKSHATSINNNPKPGSHLDCESLGDFYMEDELNLSDPTKSSWRRDLVPIPPPPSLHQPLRSGPYMDMSCNQLTPKHSRSKAVPIANSFTDSERHSIQRTQDYFTSKFSRY